MRALFTCQAGAGHWRPLVPFARALQASRHEVAFATTLIGSAGLAEHGFRCFIAGRDDADEPPDRPDGEEATVEPPQAPFVWANLFAGSRAARSLPDLLAIGRDWRPSLIVREISEFGGCVAAERLDIPHAAVQVSAWRPHLHRLIAEPLNRLRVGVSLPPDPELAMLYRHGLLTPLPPSMRDAAAPLPPTTRAVRHVPFDHDGSAGLPDWVARLPAAPTVYATLGTAYNRTPGVLRAILAGLRDEAVNLIVTVGSNQDTADFGPQPSHVHIERYLPQSLLFPRCDLVVSHGGFGTMLTALGNGLPMVVVPIAADQPDNAQLCSALGVAETIAPNGRTAAAIQGAARAVLRDARFRRNAERLRDEMGAMAGPERAAAWLERLAAGRGDRIGDIPPWR